MQNPSKKGKFVAVITTLILIISSLMVLSVEPVNSQSPDSAVKLMQVTNEHLTISHYGSSRLVMPLEKGDHIDGNYVVSNIFYYPKWPFVDLKAYVFVEDPNNEKIYDVYSNDSGCFSFTALESGNYTFFAASNLVDELYWSCYLSTSEINQATPLGITLNYTITGAPLEITITSPTIQTSLQSNVSIDFSFNRIFDWAGYVLDGADVVPLWICNRTAPKSYANTTLTGLSIGAHTLTMYANDSYGNLSSKYVTFSVGSSKGLGIDFLSVLPWVAIVVLVIVLTVTFYVKLYRKHIESS
jgi:hypothetical protein